MYIDKQVIMQRDPNIFYIVSCYVFYQSPDLVLLKKVNWFIVLGREFKFLNALGTKYDLSA